MSQKLPSLNGWRAISVLLVLAYHCQFVAPPGLSEFFAHWADGKLGVRFFFTISGFLITWLMLVEKDESGSVSLKNFYIRRCLRIWPLYFAYVLLAAMTQLFGIHQSPESWRGMLTFTRNFHEPVYGHNPDMLTGHLWSLSIEEQFYFVWPFVICIFGNRLRIAVLSLAIIFSMAFRFAMLHVLHHGGQATLLFQDDSTFCYLDWLAWGCLAAIALMKFGPQIKEFCERNKVAIFCVCFGLVAIPSLSHHGEATGIQAFGFTGLLLQSVVCPQYYRCLNWKWVERIGVLSFSIYVWQPAAWFFWPKHLPWPLWVPVVFVLAWISYDCLEKPFLGLRAKFRVSEPVSRKSQPVSEPALSR